MLLPKRKDGPRCRGQGEGNTTHQGKGTVATAGRWMPKHHPTQQWRASPGPPHVVPCEHQSCQGTVGHPHATTRHSRVNPQLETVGVGENNWGTAPLARAGRLKACAFRANAYALGARADSRGSLSLAAPSERRYERLVCPPKRTFSVTTNSGRNLW